MQPYITVKHEAQGEITEKRSRFIANVFPVTDAATAAAIIAETKKRYWDARHNIYAYLLKNGEMRYSDDGEPGGTAGMPVLDLLKKQNTVDCLVIVTRYFGGILLGTGGLVRAYTAAAAQGIKNAEPTPKIPAVRGSVVCSYSEHEKLTRIIQDNGGIAENTEYTENVKFDFFAKETDFLKICEAVTENFCNRLKILKKDTEYKFFT